MTPEDVYVGIMRYDDPNKAFYQESDPRRPEFPRDSPLWIPGVDLNGPDRHVYYSSTEKALGVSGTVQLGFFCRDTDSTKEMNIIVFQCGI